MPFAECRLLGRFQITQLLSLSKGKFWLEHFSAVWEMYFSPSAKQHSEIGFVEAMLIG